VGVLVGTCGYIWVWMGVWGMGMIVHGGWHWYMGVRVGLCSIFSGCGGWSWSLKLVPGGTCGYVWVHMGVDGYLGVRVAWE
jgi:hypothetical protein